VPKIPDFQSKLASQARWTTPKPPRFTIPHPPTGIFRRNYLRAVQACSSPRDRALALVPFYAGARIAETVALDVDDMLLSARKGILRIYGKGQRVREIPIHQQLRKALVDWLAERSGWPGASDHTALFLNQRGKRLSDRGAHDVITRIAARAGLNDHVTAHVLRSAPARGGAQAGRARDCRRSIRAEARRGPRSHRLRGVCVAHACRPASRWDGVQPWSDVSTWGYHHRPR
jgi:integrase